MKQEIENINHTFVQDVKNIIEQGRNTAFRFRSFRSRAQKSAVLN